MTKTTDSSSDTLVVSTDSNGVVTGSRHVSNSRRSFTSSDRDFSDYMRSGSSAVSRLPGAILGGGFAFFFGLFIITMLWRASNGYPFLGFSNFLTSVTNSPIIDFFDGVDRFLDAFNKNILTSSYNDVFKILGLILTWFISFWNGVFRLLAVIATFIGSLFNIVFYSGGANGFNSARDALWNTWIS